MSRISKTDSTEKEIIMGKNLVVIGGGAGGPSAAAEARRRDKSLNVTMIEKGDFVSYAA
jgi:NADH dehydrogenase FAD-containing subunit